MVDSRISRPWCRPTALPDPMVRSSNAKIIGRATFHRWVLTGLDRAETEIRTMRFGRDDIRRTVHFHESRTLKPGFCSAIRPKSSSISSASVGNLRAKSDKANANDSALFRESNRATGESRAGVPGAQHEFGRFRTREPQLDIHEAITAHATLFTTQQQTSTMACIASTFTGSVAALKASKVQVRVAAQRASRTPRRCACFANARFAGLTSLSASRLRPRRAGFDADSSGWRR